MWSARQALFVGFANRLDLSLIVLIYEGFSAIRRPDRGRDLLLRAGHNVMRDHQRSRQEKDQSVHEIGPFKAGC